MQAEITLTERRARRVGSSRPMGDEARSRLPSVLLGGELKSGLSSSESEISSTASSAKVFSGGVEYGVLATVSICLAVVFATAIDVTSGARAEGSSYESISPDPARARDN